jgi:cell wall-associated NlpC family hydrolase
MTGSHTYRSFVGSIATAIVFVTALSIVFADQASAHHLKNYRKERHHVEDRSRSVTGTPYRYGGTSPNGFDCSGFTQWVFDGHGASLPHNSTSQFQLPKNNDKYRRVWKRSKLATGDLVFHDTSSGRVGHVGIYIGKGKFISSTSSGGVRVRSLYDSYWGPRWVGATRVPATRRY